MLIRTELKAAAKDRLRGRWGRVGLAYLVLYLSYMVALVMVSRMRFASHMASLILTGPITLGGAIYALAVSRGDPPRFGAIFDGFEYFWKSVGLHLWRSLWILLWMLLLVVPGIIKAISYSMSFFIMADDPVIGVREALVRSKAITYGYRKDLFVLGISFIGWALLSALSLGVGFFWLVPYVYVTYANAYAALRDRRPEQDGQLPEGDGRAQPAV